MPAFNGAHGAHTVDAQGRHMLWSDDPQSPADRLVIQVDDETAPNGMGGWFEVREETATMRFATRSDAEVHDKLVLSPKQAEWLCRRLGSVLGLRVSK